MEHTIAGWAVGLTLWTMVGLMLAIVHGRITQARDTQIPIDNTTGDTMTNHEWRDDPHYIVTSNGAYSVLLDSEGDVLPVVDAFCKGYAEAILFADAYTYDGVELMHDDNATYAYQSPGRWWEGMGIDFTDAIDFLAANYVDLAHVIPNDNYDRIARVGLWEGHGHDFALTRNSHGAGFWDRGYGEIGDRLTEAAQAYGEHSVLTTEDSPTVETL